MFEKNIELKKGPNLYIFPIQGSVSFSPFGTGRTSRLPGRMAPPGAPGSGMMHGDNLSVHALTVYKDTIIAGGNFPEAGETVPVILPAATCAGGLWHRE